MSSRGIFYWKFFPVNRGVAKIGFYSTTFVEKKQQKTRKNAKVLL